MDTRAKLIEEIFQNMAAMRRLFASCASPSDTKKSGPTRAQTWLMFMLAHTEAMGVKELAERFSMSSSAVTQLITGLVKQKLILRQTDQTDRRKLHLKLTRKGEAVLQKMKKKRMSVLAERFQVLSEEELQQLKAIQEKILV